MEKLGKEFVNMRNVEPELRDQDWRACRRRFFEESQKTLRTHAGKKASMEETLAETCGGSFGTPLPVPPKLPW